MRQVVCRHDAAREEMVGDPVGRIILIEAIGPILMGEDMQEKPAVRLHPTAHALQKRSPVRHMLEHFDGDDTVKPIPCREVIHVGGDDVRFIRPSF